MAIVILRQTHSDNISLTMISSAVHILWEVISAKYRLLNKTVKKVAKRAVINSWRFSIMQIQVTSSQYHYT